MTELPLDQVVRLTAWDVSAAGQSGRSYGSSLTAGRIGPHMRYMLTKTMEADFYRVTRAPERFFLPEDQQFVLVAAPGGGFRILKHQTGLCAEAGPWWADPSFRGTSVRELGAKPLDEASQSQIFFAEPGEGFSGVDAYKLFCLVDGERVDLTAAGKPNVGRVNLALAKPGSPSSDLYAVQPVPGAASPDLRGPSPAMNLKMTNRTRSEATIEVSWSGGSLPPLVLKPFQSEIVKLDGTNPPHGTAYTVTARTAGKVVDGGTFPSGPSMYNPHSEFELVDFVSARGADVGFTVSLNIPRQ